MAVSSRTVSPLPDPRMGPGTKDWAEIRKTRLQMAVRDLERAPESLEMEIDIGDRGGAWRLLADADGHTFSGFDDFCRAPLPHGLGRDPHRLRGEIQTAKERVQTMAGKATPLAPAPKKGGPSANPSGLGSDDYLGCVKPKQDRGAQYYLDRIARDAPDLLEKVKAGHIKSARQAAIQAGIVKVKPADPFKAVVRALDKLSLDRLRELRDTLDKFIEAKETAA